MILLFGDNNIKCTWKNLTDAVRYDRRIQHNCFKYFILLEDVFRAALDRKKLYNAERKDFFDGFKSIINDYVNKCNDDFIEGIKYDLIKSNIQEIIKFRNSIMHNDILLGKKINGKDLSEIIRIIYNILPKDYKPGFLKDINGAKNNLSSELNNLYVELSIS